MNSETLTFEWKVLLIGGNSGAGKTTVARKLSQRFDVPWLQVDDFRLVLEHNTDPRQIPVLHYFDDLSTVYRNPPETLAKWRIATAEATSKAIEVVVANHASFGGPAILEGDDLIPSLARQTSFAGLEVRQHDVRAVFLVETNAETIWTNMGEQGRDFASRPDNERWAQVHMSRLYGEWLEREAERSEVPVVRPRPWGSLTDRVLAAID